MSGKVHELPPNNALGRFIRSMDLLEVKSSHLSPREVTRTCICEWERALGRVLTAEDLRNIASYYEALAQELLDGALQRDTACAATQQTENPHGATVPNPSD